MDAYHSLTFRRDINIRSKRRNIQVKAMKEDKSKRKLGIRGNSVFHSSELFVIDWLPASFVVKRGIEWLKSYFDSYSLVGNYVVYHNPTSWKGVYYSSNEFPPVAEWEFDPLSRVLSEAEARGLAVLI
ncbi:MAG: hypothetical protein DRJ46_03730, partial [Thermoprotei archaeon]